MQNCKTKTFFQDRSAPESLPQCRLFWALEAQGVVSKHPRVGSIPYFGVCLLADQVFDSSYRGAPQLKVAPNRVKLLCAGRPRNTPGRRWPERKPRAVQAQATNRNRCHSAPTGLQETSTTNGLCTGTMQGLWKLQHPGRATNHLVTWKRMRPL